MANPVALPIQTSAQDVWKRRIAWILLVFSMLLLVGSITLFIFTIFTPSASVETIMDVSLPGGRPSFDQMALDPIAHRLFIAHSGGKEVLVFDITSNTVVKRIPNIQKNHGIVVIPALNRVYVSETFDNQVYVIDEKTLQIIAKVPVGQKPDMIAYDPNDHRLFVSNELGKSDSVIDVNTNQVIATIPLKGQAGNTRYDAILHRVFVSVQTLDQVVSIDPVSLRIVGTATLPSSCQVNHGIILDEAQHLGFVACINNSQLVVLNVQSLQVLSTQTVGTDPDLMAFDNSRHLLYVATHSGVLSIFSDQGASVQKVYEQCLATNAHSVLVDSDTHKIYLPIVSISGDTCPPPTPAPSPTSKATPAASAPGGPSVLRIALFHYGGM